MRTRIPVAMAMAAGVMLAACGQKAAEQPPAAASAPAPAAPTVFGTMNGTVIPTSNKIWELSGNLYNDKGNLDAKQLTDAQWAEIKDSAVTLSAGAKTLAGTTGIKVAPAGGKIQSEGTPEALGAADVQKILDADPKTFSEHALKLAALADEIAAAAAAKDAMKTDDAQSRMTEECEACHKVFWYPNQK